MRIGHGRLPVNAFVCPSCHVPLSRRRSRYGFIWVCPSCHGRAMTLQLLRKVITRPVVNQLWQKAHRSTYPKKRACPACRRKMTEIPVQSGSKTEYLDTCSGCHFVWFDHREFSSLPRVPSNQPAITAESHVGRDPSDMPQDAREAMALARLAALEDKQQRERTADNVPDEWWQVAVAYLGIPIEYNYTPLRHRPWVTWLLTAAIALVSVIALADLKAAVSEWGMVPAQWGRHHGLTFVTSFFLHGGIAHLLGNLYFLWIFGDNTEDILGKGRYLLLIALSALAGDVAHILSQPDATIPAIGASGGISGILAYYCLRFPNASMGVVVWYHWVRIPAWTMLIIWIFFQILGAHLQKLDATNVAAFAHLGGAAVGVLFWLLTRRAVCVNAERPR